MTWQFPLDGIVKGNDTFTEQAITEAKRLARGYASHAVVAEVDRRDGLIIRLSGTLLPGWHFATALCGYGGTGSHATAEILELFGFGDRKVILAQIDDGGDHAHYSFRK